MPIPKELRNTYIRSGEEKRRTLDRLWQTAKTEKFSTESLEPLKQFSHKLAGSGGSYGFHTLGDAARSLESAILGGEDESRLIAAYEKLGQCLVEFSKTPLE